MRESILYMAIGPLVGMCRWYLRAHERRCMCVWERERVSECVVYRQGQYAPFSRAQVTNYCGHSFSPAPGDIQCADANLQVYLISACIFCSFFFVSFLCTRSPMIFNVPTPIDRFSLYTVQTLFCKHAPCTAEMHFLTAFQLYKALVQLKCCEEML